MLVKDIQETETQVIAKHYRHPIELVFDKERVEVVRNEKGQIVSFTFRDDKPEWTNNHE